MKELFRYLGLLVTLSAEERNDRVRRVLDRAARRSKTLRRAGLAPDAPSLRSFRRALTCDFDELCRRMRVPDAARGPLHADLDARARAIAASRPDDAGRILARADDLLARRFDLLGSGPRPPAPLNWSSDWRSGKRWESAYWADVPIVRGDGSDVKVPWELSRFQHLVILGQAYRLAPHVREAGGAAIDRSRYAQEAVEQIDGWLLANPMGMGVHWTCAMEVAIRAFVWIATLAFFRDAPAWSDDFLVRWARALWVHGRHIRGNLEIGGDGLTSNHYLSDVVGLYAIGVALPELREASEWRSFAASALTEEMARQVGADGVDFERSIPYHGLVTEIFLHGALLARAEGRALPDGHRGRLAAMLEFLRSYTRQDGSAPQWGDNDDGRLLPLDGYGSTAPLDHRHLLAIGGRLFDRPEWLAAAGDRDLEALWLLPARAEAAGRSDEPLDRAFSAGGYYVLRSKDMHLGVPCGPVGTAGLGNHSHNDLFSLTLHAAGTEWISDPGSGAYTGDPSLRNFLRSTAAHATLQLGSREQNELPQGLDGLFRVTERARPRVLEWASGDDETLLRAAHEGFRRGSDRWVHERTIRFRRSLRVWLVLDRLSGAQTHRAGCVRVRFPLGLGVRALLLESGSRLPNQVTSSLSELSRLCGPSDRTIRSARLVSESGASLFVVLDLPSGSELSVEAGIVSPRYGVVLPSPVLVAKAPEAASVTIASVLYSPAEPPRP